MSQENIQLPNISRHDEEQFLTDTLSLIRSNAASYGSQVRQMQEEIDQMLEHYHDNDTELLTILNNTVTLHEHMKLALERNQRALKKPYFGRIIFRDETTGHRESLYIGRGGISRDTIHPIVIDWRAPAANAYYENNLGKCSYQAPGGEEMPIDLLLKRTYEIEDSRLLDYYDSEVIANDDLLTRYLAKNKQAVLGEIVATIQKEQNEIIRLTPYRNLIVQGAAGSGKTTVAMHRISYILYNYAERFRPDDFYIVGSNRILLNYITGVLPELDVHGVRQMTMEQLFIRLLYEEWDERKFRLRTMGTASRTEDTAPVSDSGDIRSSLIWFEDLKSFCDEFERSQIPISDIYLETPPLPDAPRAENAPEKADRVLLLSRETIESYIRQNPSVSLQNKINGLGERLMNQIQNHFLEHIGRYTENERKEILRSFRGWFGGKKLKLSIFGLYDSFLNEQRKKGYRAAQPAAVVVKDQRGKSSRVTELDIYDLAALAYLYARVTETEIVREAQHIVIDEAQDFGMMAYAVLSHCIRGCTYTIMGDVSQNIRYGSGLNDWEELRKLLLRDRHDSFRVLKKSYRNTVEIAQYAGRILRHGKFFIYPVEPIIRHGSPVSEISVSDGGAQDGRQTAESSSAHQEAALVKKASRILTDWQKRGYGTIAVICRTDAEAARTAAMLKQYMLILGGSPEDAVFGEGVMVLPVEFTKGLEFDAVLIFNPSREDYPVDDGHAKLLYVAATRALHELCVLHTGDLTGLISEEPSGGAHIFHSDENLTAPAFQKNTAEKPTSLFFASGKSLPMPDRHEAENALKRARQKASSQSQASPPNLAAAASQNRQAAAAASSQSQNARTAAASQKKQAAPTMAASSQPSAAPANRAASPTQNRQATASPRDQTAGRQKTASRPAFGDTPPADTLRPPGHSRIDLAVRWISRQADGLYLQSRYGILRLSPINSRIIRVTFAKIGKISPDLHPGLARKQPDKAWMYREIGGAAELLTDDLCLRTDKSSGSIRYMTRDKYLLTAEDARLCRQLEAVNDVSLAAWLYLNPDKKECLTAVDAGRPTAAGRLNLRGQAYQISPDNADRPFPLILSDRGYGLMIAAGCPVIFCDMPAYGTYIHIGKVPQMDFYFLAGETEQQILDQYDFLCGGH